MFYENDIPRHVYQLEIIAEDYGIRITDIDIWDLASRLAEKMNSQYPNLDIDYFINGLDSDFYINQESITDFKQFHELVISN